jgi:Fe-S-cluster-containing dehydrogenase component
MLIDLQRCVACDACTMACRQEKGSERGLLFAKVLKYETGDYPDSRLGYLPVLCNHCGNPPCVEVCPSGATKKLEDGIVVVDQALCVGCRNCLLACPYGARNGFLSLETYFPGYRTPFEELKSRDRLPKKVDKCDFCVERLGDGRLPACVEACPTEARIFGNLDDQNGPVNRLLAERNYFCLRPELDTRPSVYYLRPK